MSEVTMTAFLQLQGQVQTLLGQVNRLQSQIENMDERLAAQTENINLLRGDRQRVEASSMVLAGPVASAHVPTPPVAVVEGDNAAVVDTHLEGEQAAVQMAMAGRMPATSDADLTPAMRAANEAIARKAEESAERRAKRKAEGR